MTENYKFKLNDLYAHRGFHDKPVIPENSLAAFRRAIEHGFGSEFDVHLIADGSLVVFHDEQLERETGVVGEIEDYDLINLRKLRLEGTDEYIPTFDEVLELYEQNPGPDGHPYPLLIELKVARNNYVQLVDKVCRRLERYSGEYVIESFDPRAVIELRRRHPEITRGQLVENFMVRGEALSKTQRLLLSKLVYNYISKPDFISFRFADRTMPALKRELRRDGVSAAVWTVRSPKAFRAARRMGASVIFEKFNPKEV